MSEMIIAIGLGIFALIYCGYHIWWMTNDIEKKIKEQRKEVLELKNYLFEEKDGK